MGCYAPAARGTLSCPQMRAQAKWGEPPAPYTKWGAGKLPNQNLRHTLIKRTQSDDSAPDLAKEPRLISAPAGTAGNFASRRVY